MMRRLLPVLLFFLLLPAVYSQGIKSVIQSFSGTEKPRAPELSPAEQLEWVRQQLAEVPEEEALAEAMRPRLEKAGLPPSTLEDFLAAAREARLNYQMAIDALSGVLAGEGDPAALEPAEVPANEQEASEMRDTLRREDLTARASESEVHILQRQILQRQALSEKASAQLRQLKEEISLAKSPEAAARAQIESELAMLEKRALDAAIFFGKWKIAEQSTTLKLARSSADSIRAALHESGFDRQLDPRRVKKQISDIARETAEAEKALADAVEEQDQAQAALAKLKADSVAADSPQLGAAQDLASATQGLVVALRGSVRVLDIERAHWLSVKDLTENASSAEVRDAVNDTRENLRIWEEWQPTIDKKLIEAKEAIAAAQKETKEAPPGGTRKSLEKVFEMAQKRDAALGALVTRAKSMAATQEEFLREVETMLSREGVARRFARAWDGFQATVALIWTHELFAAGGNSITVGKVAMSVLGSILSLVLAGMISRLASRAASKNFRLAETQRTLFEKSVFVPVAALFVLTVLYWLNIPLTVFAFFGGALAIGVGFGVQNLMNNFISGIILLLEHQIKVGDIIEVAGSTGKVTHLGSRCSRIRQFDGVELLVPNSAFLEKEVTNWTMADPHHRYDFVIGVAYGSPVEKVMDLLLSAVERQPEILQHPPPGVFFEEFGDSSLNFRILYWLELGGTLDPRLVGSQVRVRIERDFRAAGIEIPFPQRDLNLRNAGTVSVRLERPQADE